MIMVRNLEQVDGRTFFTVEHQDGGTYRYRTNRNGEGIYRMNDNGTDAGQVAGNSQFNLNCARSTQYRRIRKFFES